MARQILVPVDGSDPAWDALSFALEQHPDADVTAYYVIDVLSVAEEPIGPTAAGYESELYEVQEETAEEVLADAEQIAEVEDVEIETAYDRGFPREEILDYAESHDVDQIIIGSHGRTGLTRVFLGSVAEKVTRHAPAPVTVVRPETTDTA